VKAEQATASRPTVDLSTTSVEFALEIKGDPESLTQVPDVALDAQGNLLVIDGENGRIQRFDRRGGSLGSWGSPDQGDGQFHFACLVGHCAPDSLGGTAVDGEGHVYVVDPYNSRVQKLDSDGSFLTKWGEYGSGDGQFPQPLGVAVDGQGHVYVTDAARGDIQKFDGEGRFLTKWTVMPSISTEALAWVAPAVDESGNVYVPSDDIGTYAANDAAGEVLKFDSEGKLLMTFGKSGRGDGEFLTPTAVAVDRQGNVYVADRDRHCIQKFNQEGNFLAKWGSRGTDPGQFGRPTGLAVDVDGTIYVADLERVHKLSQQ